MAYNNVITVIPTFKTPNRVPNDFGVFMFPSNAITTPTASIANNVVPKKSGNSLIGPIGARSEIDGRSTKT